MEVDWEAIGRSKRALDSDSGESCSTNTSNSALTAAAKRAKAKDAPLPEQQRQQQHFFSPLHSECSQQPHFPSGPLQPAASATRTWHTAFHYQDGQQQQQPAQHSSKPGTLPRTSSAPELLKLAQADSAAWQNQHPTHNNMQQAGFLSHQDHWLT